MSKLSYSLTMRILEVLPRVIHPEPNVLNSTLIEHPSATLPPLDLSIPREKSLFDQLLEGQENRRIGNRREFDYVGVTAQSPLHRTPSQRTPAWIVTHMGIEGEGQVSEWARLEPGMGVRLFDEGLGEKNYGFEKCGCLGSLEGLTVGNLGTTSSGWNRTSLPSRDILFQSGFLPHSSQFLIAYFLNGIILIKLMSVHWDRG